MVLESYIFKDNKFNFNEIVRLQLDFSNIPEKRNINNVTLTLFIF